MRNYWALLPAIAVCVVLILGYAIPTLINPQWTGNVLSLFRPQPSVAGNEEPAVLTPQRISARRRLAASLVVGALALVGFNISLNREANGCYQAAKAWGAQDSERETADPCIDMIYGSPIGYGEGEVLDNDPQPVAAYQLVRDKKPAYLRWIQNRPQYDKADLLVGTTLACALNLKVDQGEEKITVVTDTAEPCPAGTSVSLTSIELDEPLGDRAIVTADGKPVRQIDPDLDSWGTVLSRLVTGG